MINQWIKFISICLCTILLISCGNDDERDTPSLAALTDLVGDWIDESVSSDAVEDGFIALVFDVSDSSAAVSATTPNEAGISCEDVIFRNIAPSGTNTFAGEGLLSSGSGYEEVTLTLVDEQTINIDWNCTSCLPAVDVLKKAASLSDVLPIVVSSNIVEETTFYNIVCDPDIPDYVVTDVIAVREHLTILPGVVIAFEANAGLDITDVNAAGSLTAEGTGPEQIRFTGTEKEAGFWRGLSFESNDVRNLLKWATVEYAGSDPIVTYGTGVALHGAVAIESQSGFNGSLSMERTTISNTSGNGLIVEEGTLLRDFEANSFINNTESAVRINANNVGALDAFSDFLGGSGEFGTNGFNGVEINASGGPVHDITDDATWPALANGAVYRVAQSFDVEAQITIMPGAIIEFEANQTAFFKQNLDTPLGILVAKGTASEPITFTGAVKTAGYWTGLVIQSNSLLNEIDHCIVEYGGSDSVVTEAGNIVLDKDGAYSDPELIVTNSIIRHSARCGIVVDSFGGNLTQSGNTFSDNIGSTSPQCY